INMFAFVSHIYPPLCLSSQQQSVHAKESTEELEVAVLKTCQSISDLRREVAVGRTTDLLKVHGEHLSLRALKAAGAEGNLEAVAEYSRMLTEQKEQLVEEQTSMAKLGLELRLLSSDVDSELEKWEEQEHDIVRQSQSVASMAYNMYLFTRYQTLHLHSIHSSPHIYGDP
ncbi:hypothetical protein GOODEAATRI_006578, partial [Goodea atripinnis]